MFQTWADLLRRVAAELVNAPPAILAECTASVRELQHTADLFSESTVSVKHGKWFYTMSFLLQQLLLGASVHSHSHMKDVVRQSLQASLPSNLVEAFIARVDRARLPSRTTLYRHRLTLHIAFLRMLQQINAHALNVNAAAVYQSSDSSPIGGTDWLNTLVCRVSHSDLLQCVDDAALLVRHGREEVLLDAAEVAAACERLKRTLRMRPATPVGIGSGAGSATHKLHALIHQHLLETNSIQQVCNAFNSTVSFTGDQGTERLFARFPPFHITTLFPWLRGEGSVEDTFDWATDAVPQMGGNGTCNENAFAWHDDAVVGASGDAVAGAFGDAVPGASGDAVFGASGGFVWQGDVVSGAREGFALPDDAAAPHLTQLVADSSSADIVDLNPCA
jgi:hypothetical protein